MPINVMESIKLNRFKLMVKDLTMIQDVTFGD